MLLQTSPARRLKQYGERSIPETSRKIKEGTASREGETVVLLNGFSRVVGQVPQKVFDNLALLLFAHRSFYQLSGGANRQVGGISPNLGHRDALLRGDPAEALFDGLLGLGFRFLDHLLAQVLGLDAGLFDEVVSAA